MEMINCKSRLCGKFKTKKDMIALYKNNEGYYIQIMSTGKKYPITDKYEIADVYDGIMPKSIV